MQIRLTRILLGLVLALFALQVQAQRGTINGRVTDDLNQPIDSLGVEIIGTTVRTLTNSEGRFTLVLEPGTYTLRLSRAGYEESRREITLRPAASENLYVKMTSRQMSVVEIRGTQDPKGIQDPDNAFVEILPLEPDKIVEMTSVKGDLTSRLATLGQGVSIGNEFSSQYRVRGGNYDENLIYVNGIEIYRPFLVRSGQQEGLGFVNPQLIEEVGFSAGGFKAQYGDKMSSVLDVTYKTPTRLGGSVELGVLNQSMHLEGIVTARDSTWNDLLRQWEFNRRPNAGRLHILFGARRFTPQYVLSSLDTKGEYKPVFYDGQTLLTFVPKHKDHAPKIRERRDGTIDTTYIPSERWSITGFGNFALNNYVFTPQARESTFGTIQRVFRLRVAFAGQELMSYATGIGALSIDHRPSYKVKLKYIFSGFRSLESETFDVEGGYFLSDVNTNLGSEDFNDVVFDRGIGTFFRHGRNFLDATVLSAEQQGTWFPGRANRHKVQWGLRWQGQYINDQLKEWGGVDSAGYFTLQESYRNEGTLNSFLMKAFVQDHWKISHDMSKRLVVGGRAIYNDLNGELLLAPRIQFVIDPSSKIRPSKGDLEESEYVRDMKNRRYQLRFAAGVYHQPTFYREMRDFNGALYTQLPAQTSYHLIAGGDYLFTIWKRPFKLFAEAYYKYLTDLVPYEVENVRVRYYPQYTADGFAYGLDTRVTGEFIKGVDSWMTIGFMKTQERIRGLGQGYVPRPADQRLTFGMYFQDELPINPTYKVHINFVYGSGTRFGPPRVVENRTAFDMPSYQRVDLGFSKVIMINPGGALEPNKLKVESVWISAEIFNLFQRQNTISYTWIKDVYNTQFAVPNYLSARLLNLRVLVRF